jgi:hypothetical protein
MNLSVLQLGPNSTGTSGNRTVEFGCLIWDSRYNVFQSSTALSRVSGLADWSIGGGPHPMSAVPTFKLPTGYLELYLGGYGCGQHDVGIVSGAPAVFTDYYWEYYYCAVISDAVGSTQPFTVHWSQFKDLLFVPPQILQEFENPASVAVTIPLKLVPFPGSCFIRCYHLPLPNPLPIKKCQKQLCLATQNSVNQREFALDDPS